MKFEWPCLFAAFGLALHLSVNASDSAQEVVSEIMPVDYALASEIASALDSEFNLNRIALPAVPATGWSPGPPRYILGSPDFHRRIPEIIEKVPMGANFQGWSRVQVAFDERSNWLVVTAPQEQLCWIEEIVSQLDVIQPQFLIQCFVIQVPESGLAACVPEPVQ